MSDHVPSHNILAVSLHLLVKLWPGMHRECLCGKFKMYATCSHLWPTSGQVQKWSGKDIQPLCAMGELNKVFGNPKSPYIINVLILEKVIYMSRQTGREMHVEMVKYQVYQQFKAKEYKAKLKF